MAAEADGRKHYIIKSLEADGRIENAHHELNSNSILDYETFNMSYELDEEESYILHIIKELQQKNKKADTESVISSTKDKLNREKCLNILEKVYEKGFVLKKVRAGRETFKVMNHVSTQVDKVCDEIDYSATNSDDECGNVIRIFYCMKISFLRRK